MNIVDHSTLCFLSFDWEIQSLKILTGTYNRAALGGDGNVNQKVWWEQKKINRNSIKERQNSQPSFNHARSILQKRDKEYWSIKTIHSFISVILNRYNGIFSIILCKCEQDGENNVENIPIVSHCVIKRCPKLFYLWCAEKHWSFNWRKYGMTC